MGKIVYVRMKKYVSTSEKAVLRLRDIAFVEMSPQIEKRQLENRLIYKITDKDSNYVVIDGFMIIHHLQEEDPSLEIQLIGPNQSIIHVQEKQKKMPVWVAAIVWVILFLGSAMTIMNFHYDVSMQEVQQKLHLFLTGKEEEFPLTIQVPYSFGLGIGMLVFFNHWFKKRFNEEPSPLEIEIFKYQESINDYIIDRENKLNVPRDTR